jgi:hypothetical protein
MKAEVLAEGHQQRMNYEEGPEKGRSQYIDYLPGGR